MHYAGEHETDGIRDLLRSTERVTLTRIEICEGSGVPDDPCRIVVYWVLDDGRRLLREDEWEKRQGFK